MSSAVNILEGGVMLAAGEALCYFLMWWKEHDVKPAKPIEADGLLTKAKSEAEGILRDAKQTAAEEANKLRDQLEQSFAARRAERVELERRLTERETLINSQLQRIVDAEKTLTEQKTTL